MYNKGFTLIEFVIVASIIAILAGFAIPAYQDYLIRAKTSEAIKFIDALKPGLGEYYDTYQKFPTSLREIGQSSDTLSGHYLSSLTINENGIITAVIDYGSGQQTIYLVPTP